MSAAVSSSSTKSRHNSNTMGTTAANNSHSSSSAPTTTTSSCSSSSSSRPMTQSMMLRLINFLTILLRIVIWPLRQLMGARGENNLDGLSPAVTAKAAQQFVSHLRTLATTTSASSSASRNSDTNSSSNDTNSNLIDQAWTTVGFDAARVEAAANQSLLLVCLHSPLHRSSSKFCKDIFVQDAAMRTFLSEQPHITALGFSIHSGQGAHLAQLLQARAYPFCALLQPKPSSATAATNGRNNTAAAAAAAASPAMNLLFRAEGPSLLSLKADDLLSYWQLALRRHEIALQEFEARRLQRQEEQALRRQQDEEYQATLMADQERERQRLEAQQEEARAVERAAEAEALKVQEEERLLRETQALVPPEPAAGTSGTCNVRFVLPSGTKLNRRFMADDKISNLKAYIRMHYHDKDASSEMGTVGLSTNFPRQSYNDEGDDDKTLQEAGLVPQAVLMVQDLDA